MRFKKEILNVIPSVVLYLAFIFSGISSAQAFEPGKTYDSSNWREIKDITISPILNWIKHGELIIKTAKLNYEYKHSDRFLEASQRNIGKLDIDPEGILIDRQTGERVELIYGLPFPDIDPNDYKAGAKIMENFAFQRYRMNRAKSVLCKHAAAIYFISGVAEILCPIPIIFQNWK